MKSTHHPTMLCSALTDICPSMKIEAERNAPCYTKPTTEERVACLWAIPDMCNNTNSVCWDWSKYRIHMFNETNTRRGTGVYHSIVRSTPDTDSLMTLSLTNLHVAHRHAKGIIFATRSGWAALIEFMRQAFGGTAKIIDLAEGPIA